MGAKRGGESVAMRSQNRTFRLGQRRPWTVAETAVSVGHQHDAATLERSENPGQSHPLVPQSSEVVPAGSPIGTPPSRHGTEGNRPSAPWARFGFRVGSAD